MLNFTVLAKVEDMEEDAAYFMMKSNLLQRLKLKTRKNNNLNSKE